MNDLERFIFSCEEDAHLLCDVSIFLCILGNKIQKRYSLSLAILFCFVLHFENCITEVFFLSYVTGVTVETNCCHTLQCSVIKYSGSAWSFLKCPWSMFFLRLNFSFSSPSDLSVCRRNCNALRLRSFWFYLQAAKHHRKV